MTPEFVRRIAFTLGALLLYRLGTYIPLPGLDLGVLGEIFNHDRDGLLGMANAASGGAIGQPSIFSLSITPYISAAIVLQLIALVSSKFNAIGKRGESGRRAMGRYTFGLTLLLTVFQAFGIAEALQRVANLITHPGSGFLISTTATLAGGTIFLIWLSEQITLRGIGNGLALILCTGIVMDLMQTVVSTIRLGQSGLLSGNSILLLVIVAVAVVGFIVFIERARRHVPVEFAGWQLGGRSVPPQRSHLSLKLNGAGLIPAIIAPWFFYLPLTIFSFAFGSTESGLTATFRHMQPGQPAHMTFTSVAIIVLALIYTAFVMDPEQAADSLNRNDGAIPGIAPGEATATHLDHVVSYTALVGAAYLVLMLLIPEALIAYARVTYYFGGASALILVCAVLDIEAQVRGGLLVGRGGKFHEIDSSRTAGGGQGNAGPSAGTSVRYHPALYW